MSLIFRPAFGFKVEPKGSQARGCRSGCQAARPLGLLNPFLKPFPKLAKGPKTPTSQRRVHIQNRLFQGAANCILCDQVYRVLKSNLWCKGFPASHVWSLLIVVYHSQRIARSMRPCSGIGHRLFICLFVCLFPCSLTFESLIPCQPVDESFTFSNVGTRLVKGTGIIESVFPYYGSYPLFKGTRILESFFFGQAENKIKKTPQSKFK